jgi:CO/xanthine dehydrogenase Mo-binding subunit
MAYKLIGKNFTPHDVVAKVTGKAKYAEDFRAEGMVFCKLLSSPMPHARIRNIDASDALKTPGVLGILTADDVPQFPPPQTSPRTKSSMLASRSSRSPPKTKRSPRTHSRRSSSTSSSCRTCSTRSTASTRAGRMRVRTAT